MYLSNPTKHILHVLIQNRSVQRYNGTYNLQEKHNLAGGIFLMAIQKYVDIHTGEPVLNQI